MPGKAVLGTLANFRPTRSGDEASGQDHEQHEHAGHAEQAAHVRRGETQLHARVQRQHALERRAVHLHAEGCDHHRATNVARRPGGDVRNLPPPGDLAHVPPAPRLSVPAPRCTNTPNATAA